ncbi:SubName: Full=Uncharacterized protein {ECO:0000313/EMBL:CCA67682.1} [Serendipita indica DSM 11827]|nr:SubName: Full=Uncharacterized protein {ECO:0000313/EMBL:CCA67682.1} [Serendipita indica DSM 11827]
MPKSQKKQAEKQNDFKKSRLKLGKGKKPASNAVDTSFKAHSIALPTQSITVDKSQAGPSTKRRHTIQDLLSLPEIDAIAGLRELLQAHSDLMLSTTSSVIPECCRLVADEDASVRKASIEFLDWYLSRLPNASIIPHAATIMLFATSAQTHIFPEIRIDAIKFMTVLLSVCPEMVISRGPSGHSQRVLHGYLSLLVGNVGAKDSSATPTSTTILSAQSKLIVITSLALFLEKSRAVQYEAGSLWFLRNSFRTRQSYNAFTSLFYPLHHDSRQISGTQPEVIRRETEPWLTSTSWDLQEIQDSIGGVVPTQSDPSIEMDLEVMIEAERSLHHVLIELFLEYSPAAFTSFDKPAASLELRLIHSTIKLAHALYASPALLENTTSPLAAHLQDILIRLSLYLPIARDVPIRHSEISGMLLEMNIIFSKLSTMLILASPATELQSSMTRRSLHDKFLPRLLSWVLQTLKGDVTVDMPMGSAIPESTLHALLPTLWISLQPSENREVPSPESVLRILVDQGAKRRFIKRHTSFNHPHFYHNCHEPEYQGGFRIAHNNNSRGLIEPSGVKPAKALDVEEAILHIPRLLWSCGAGSPQTSQASQALLSGLLICAQRRALDWSPSTVSQLSQRLIPYFMVNHPTKGPIMGPFAKLNGNADCLQIQKLALDLVFALGHYGSNHRRVDTPLTQRDPNLEHLYRSVSEAVKNTVHKTYWDSLQVF